MKKIITFLSTFIALVFLIGGTVAISTAGVDIVSGMKAEGFSVKTVGDAGLRVHFVYNENIAKKNAGGYSLYEYGALFGTKENYDRYAETICGTDSLLMPNGKKISAPSGIKQTVAYRNGHYGTNNTQNGVTNFFAKFDNIDEIGFETPLTAVGYEVWEKDGEYTAVFTKFKKSEYNTFSLLSVTLGMLSDNNPPITLEYGENPIAKTIISSARETADTDNENIKAFIFDGGKTVVLMAMTKISDNQEFAEINMTSEANNYIYAANVSSSLPELNAVWNDYMKEKVAGVKKLGGKSFIFYTDTHTGHDSYSTTLIEYARKKLGIDTVIFGGDPYDTGATKEEALEKLKKFSLGEFFDIQKETGLYVLGNHDTNPITARDKGDEKYNYLISDTDMFEYTVGQSLKYGRNLVFDQKAIDAVENFTFEDNCRFTAAEMKEQAIAAMKMHYYTDDDVNKIRYIILDTGGMGVTQFAEFSQLSYCDIIFTELGWFAETLGTVPSGYDVIVAGHMQNGDSVVAKTENGQVVANEDGAFTERVSKNIASIMSLYKQGAVGTYTVKFSDFNSWSTANGNIAAYAASADNATFNDGVLTINYDFSNHTTGTIASFSGHCHVDRSYMSGFDVSTGEYKSYRCYGEGDEAYFDGGVLGILTCTDAAGYQTFKDEPPMKKGTTTGNVFDIVTITDDRLVCTRIGAGEDRIFAYN